MTWDEYGLMLAEAVSKKSKDPSTKVGAVILASDNSVVSTGYNGFPAWIEDTEERLNNREEKLKLVIHGEMNAILFAKQDLEYCTLYTWPFMPCSRCAIHVIQAGIIRIVAPHCDDPKWGDNSETINLFNEASVGVTLYHD
tara:strand:- start:107 stop:529 length:423 start_codon:yes stop_codon:yes gene_type:complete